MRIIFFLFCFFSVSISTFAALPNYDNITVKEVKADWLTDMSGNTYQYVFVNNSGGKICSGNYIASGDSNINKLLQIAHILGSKVSVGIKDCNVVTTTIIS